MKRRLDALRVARAIASMDDMPECITLMSLADGADQQIAGSASALVDEACRLVQDERVLAASVIVSLAAMAFHLAELLAGEQGTAAEVIQGLALRHAERQA